MYLQIEKLEFVLPTIEARVQTGAKIPSTEIFEKKNYESGIIIVMLETVCQNNYNNNTYPLKW